MASTVMVLVVDMDMGVHILNKHRISKSRFNNLESVVNLAHHIDPSSYAQSQTSIVMILHVIFSYFHTLISSSFHSSRCTYMTHSALQEPNWPKLRMLHLVIWLTPERVNFSGQVSSSAQLPTSISSQNSWLRKVACMTVVACSHRDILLQLKTVEIHRESVPGPSSIWPLPNESTE